MCDVYDYLYNNTYYYCYTKNKYSKNMQNIYITIYIVCTNIYNT